MNNKIEVSRELLERCIRANDEPQPSQLYADLRSLLGAPAADHCEDALHMVAPVVERQPFRFLVKSCYGPRSKSIENADESMRDSIESARQYFGAEREIDAIKAKSLVYISPGEWFAIPLYTSPPEPNIEAAAKKLAACMGYPWEHMPEQGRASMREHATAVIGAALGSKQ